MTWKVLIPVANLFSLASGGAIYLRDPHRKVLDSQLNGGIFTEMTPADWDLIKPYLVENERLFGIKIADLLNAGGRACDPLSVYRKVAVYNKDVSQPEPLEKELEGDWNS